MTVKFGVSVLAVCGRRYFAPKLVDHGLHPVADSENGQAGGVDPLRGKRRVVLIHAGGAAGEDYTDGVQSLDGVPRRSGREELTVDVGFPDTPRNQSRILGPEVDNDHSLSRCRVTGV